MNCVFPGSNSRVLESPRHNGQAEPISTPGAIETNHANEGWLLPTPDGMNLGSDPNPIPMETTSTQRSTAPQWPFTSTGLGQSQAPSPGALGGNEAMAPQEPHATHLNQGHTYIIGNVAFGPAQMSAFNWLSPQFDFDLDQLQPAIPQTLPFDHTPMLPYQALPVPPVPAPQQWPISTPASDTSDNHGVFGTAYDRRTVQGAEAYSQSPHSTDGPFYVDGTGARQPYNGRYAKSVSSATHAASPQVPPTESLAGFLFPEDEILASDYEVSAEYRDDVGMSSWEYNNMTTAFRNLCVTQTAMFDPYLSSSFPLPHLFNKSISAFWQSFYPAFPFLHRTLRNRLECHWVLSLGMAAVGYQYLNPGGHRSINAFHEFLRRCLLRYNTNTVLDDVPSEITIIQATLLNYVGMIYSGSPQQRKHRFVALDNLISYFQSNYALIAEMDSQAESYAASSVPQRSWSSWVIKEGCRRVAYSIWILDSMSYYHFKRRPRLLLEYAGIPLPCPEDLWEAPTEEKWNAVLCGPTAPLSKALRVLYVEKRLLSGIGDFARVILIHGLYCQTWEIATSISRPLYQWTPTARKEDAGSFVTAEERWLPKETSYARWRNCACDCLDVLHWIANSDIANSGTENTTVLQLHVARIVLLTPYQDIIDLVHSFVSGGWPGSAPSNDKNLRQVRRWALEDQYKARLSLIHAGVLFWHLRRYSTDAFYEPSDVFIATLVLWAYGTFCPQVDKPQTSQHDGSSSSSDSAAVNSVRLDRPTDDELVQLFIKNGMSMKATITGVGNIAGRKGPLRMLKEGFKLLGCLRSWGIRDHYMSTLLSLISIYERRPH